MPADRLLHRRAGHSQKVSRLTDLEYRVWTQYLLSADDFGVMPMTAAALQSDNYHLENRPAKTIARCLETIVRIHLLRTFEHQGRTYVYQHDWQDWQKVRWPAKTIHPIPPIDDLTLETRTLLELHPGGKRRELVGNSGSTPGVLQTNSGLTHETANGLRQTADALEGRAERETVPPFDAWLRELQGRYPPSRVTSGYRTETAFVEEFQKDTRKAPVVWAEMLENLENQKQGHEWRVKGMVPRLEKWLADGLWRQRHEASPASVVLTDKTAGTLAAAAEVLKGRAS